MATAPKIKINFSDPEAEKPVKVFNPENKKKSPPSPYSITGRNPGDALYKNPNEMLLLKGNARKTKSRRSRKHRTRKHRK